MRSKLTKIALAAALGLALAFTFSCSSGDDNNGGTSSGSDGGSSSPSGGGSTIFDGTWSRGNSSRYYKFTIDGNNWVYSEGPAETIHEYSKGTWSSTTPPTAPFAGTMTFTVTNIVSSGNWIDLPAQYESVKTNTATVTINAAGKEMIISNAALTTSGVWGTLQGTYQKQ